MSNSLFATALPFIEERGNQVVFGGKPEANWSDRAVEAAEFIIDRQYWELLGRPTELSVGFSTEEGWQRFVGDPPPVTVIWMEATEVGQ